VKPLITFFLVATTFIEAAFSQSISPAPAQESAPEFLSFNELKDLATVAEPKNTLAEKLNAVLTTPFLKNGATVNRVQPHAPNVPGLGAVVRAASWNIERGLNFDLIESAFANPEQFQRESEYENRAGNNNTIVRAQLRTLQESDVLILNEVDLGMKRTGYRDVSRDLATVLHMNYAFAVEFVEVDPLFDLGVEKIDLPDKGQEQRLEEDLKVDPERYRGLHGNAVLSRYPIRAARIVRLPVCYDWYRKETKSISQLEQGKRWSARKVFRQRIQREVRRGGRMALVVELAVPALPTGKVTVVSVHLENKCTPGCRQRQMKALLAVLQPISNPVVLAGDLNTSGRDATPTSVRNEIMKRVTDYRFWITQAIFRLSPLTVPQYAIVPLRYFHQYLDPTAFHFPFIWENRERGLFQSVEKFRFSDGYAFDFRGRTERTLNNKERTLANSNQRGRKGFVTTYAFERNFGGWVGNFKLDWFFIKPFIHNPRARGQSYRFAPHFPITMNELNQSVEERISDHPPITVDLPLAEPLPLKSSSR
jgi:endonuclease/exonuclease/phosphatase family metal-dependent hydrolase